MREVRLIEIGELKEWIEGWFKMNKYYHPYATSNNIPIPELYDILEKMPTIDPVKWISVTERLPEKAGSYLVTLQGNENAISIGGDDPFVWVKFYDGRKWHNNSWYDVLAWREKPEPWRGEER